jgi:hypothetical protein
MIGNRSVLETWTHRLGFLVGMSFLSTACGVQSVTGTGELGNIVMTISSDHYLTSDADLLNTGIVTGFAQTFSVSLTDQGESEAGDQGSAIEFSFTSATAGGDLTEVFLSDDSAPDSDTEAASFDTRTLTITATTPGGYLLTAMKNDEEFDRITLTFDRPDTLEAIVYGRNPSVSDFNLLSFSDSSSTQVDLGAQISWLVVAKNGSSRLLGELTTTDTFSPSDSVVSVAAVDHINENGITTISNEPSAVFLNSGTIELTVTDEVNSVSESMEFVVQ